MTFSPLQPTDNLLTTPLHDPTWRTFASDNYSGAHPEVLTALATANEGHQVSYGEDVYTARLAAVVEQHFGPALDGSPVECYPVFNGTGANVVALQALLPRWGAVICASTAHIAVDEGGAPERVAGIKLLPVPTPDGKLTPELIDREAWGWGNEHRAQPLVVSITQTTEYGTCYSVEEIRALTEHAHRLGMTVHLDGSRLSNAAAHCNLSFRDLTTAAGVDLVSFGGTKNGLLFGELVLALNPSAAPGLLYLRKLSTQLASKMRFISAQFLALLEGDLWLRSARHANAMAARLRAGVERLPGVQLTQPTEANGVFAILPAGVADRVRKDFPFYDWDASRNEVRWMCSFDTTEADVDAFVASVVRGLEEQSRGR
ncbi:threonine aldolase family protein [Psychromicrobium xiongbiense]|uniref:threonine aldolase family protein n=1 Tax=Psychromicrobium xiongbiense TaxID=3051184 RepID=UPI0025531111|nr:low specificity L-threonine aldolase [Psychromicrobium sp. YIM S02556]